MTTEKMTVHKALCELKTLDARIQKSIQQGTFVFANKHSNNKVAGVSIGTYSEEIRAAYQSAKTSSLAATLSSVRLRCPTLLSR